MAETPGWKAEAQDLPSIGTLHARAFHPKREAHRRIFPSSISPWWEQKYALDIVDPNCHVLKLSAEDSPTTVIGLLCLRKYRAGERGAGRWSSFPPPEQVDHEVYRAMVQSMVDYREMFMLEQPHFCIDHFGVDDEHQGRGLGKTLLGRACQIADQEQQDMFVVANEGAESFYNKFEFETKDKMDIGGIVECFLIRKHKKPSSS